MHYYCTAPIDWWNGVLTPREFVLREINDREFDGLALISHLAEVLTALAEVEARAQQEFRALGWQGDARQGPFIFGVPVDTTIAIGYALKQDDNGTTFIASPIPLPHLDSIAFKRSTSLSST